MARPEALPPKKPASGYRECLSWSASGKLSGNFNPQKARGRSLVQSRPGGRSMGKLLIIRHGHTSLNMPGRDERLRGWLDVPLDGEGLEEAAGTAEQVSRLHALDAIYCSDLRRARQTAEVLRKKTKAPITATSDLRPWNLGVFCGQRVREILPFLNLLNQHLDLAAPSGESFYQFYGRYAHRLKELLSLAEASPNSIAVVTHVRNLLATSSVITGPTGIRFRSKAARTPARWWWSKKSKAG